MIIKTVMKKIRIVGGLVPETSYAGVPMLNHKIHVEAIVKYCVEGTS